MKIKFSPQFTFDEKRIHYFFEGDTITIEFDGKTDVVDFSGTADGIAETIETIFDIPVVLLAQRTNGILHVELLNLIGPNASEEERFPNWKEAGELNGEHNVEEPGPDGSGEETTGDASGA